MRNVLGRLFFQSRPLYDIMWKSIVKLGKPQITIWRLRIACWIPKFTDKHPLCIILLFHCNYGCTNAPRCYATRTSPASLKPRRSALTVRCARSVSFNIIQFHISLYRVICVKVPSRLWLGEFPSEVLSLMALVVLGET
jgi:hypothetical protein